jgi:hypothetical protein
MLPAMKLLGRMLAGLVLGTLAAAGLYTEAHRAPDQP